ncbi:MAG: glycosyltransferase family 2 protein [Chroococcidiopsidaceae cyanobacterium CP_BM_RX_35]|nr:glycosyltransferase family 2 protein [Chroococcidiopsidaceae cyanobacterium CP_BM_RX_35]
MYNYQTTAGLPLVSVIIPAYNAELFIGKTLNSVCAQSYSNLEILVVDDGSQDQTTVIVERFVQEDHRVILLQQSNEGVASARNLAIQKSRGEYIAPIDADDIWFPENLEKQVRCMLRSDSSVGLVYSWSVDIDDIDLLTGGFRAATIEGNVYTTLICHNFLGNASASLIRRACFEKVGGYNCGMKKQNAQGCEDWDIYLRIAECYQFQVVPEVLIGYRKLFSSMSCDYSSMARSHYLMLQAVRQKHPEIPAAIYRLSSSSFYMYLARQSSQHGIHRSTLFWLYKALRADFITPLFRYGLYTLTIRSFLGLIVQPAISLTWSEHYSLAQSKQWFSSKQRVNAISDLNRRQVSIYFKVFIGSVLHRSMSIIGGNRPYA